MISIKSIRIALPMSLVLLGMSACGRKETIADRVVMAKEGNKNLDAAIETAKAELPLFWNRLDNQRPGDDVFAVKVSIHDSNGYEYFWLADIKKTGDSVSGVIDQQAQIVKCVRINQRIQVSVSEVVDWLFMSNGKMKGNFTTRALINDIPKADRDQLIQLFDKNPSIRGGA
jgi:uncharacterized protein YegJ (DUF2314 family)